MTRAAAALLTSAGLGLLLLAALARQQAAAVTNDGDVTFTVLQTPYAPALLPAGATVTFDVTGTAARDFASLFFEFDYPDGLSFTSGVSDPPGVSCTDNVPAAGVVRCDYGAVVAGALVPLRLTFAVADGAVAVTAPSQARMRAGVSDGQPDAADGASGDDRFLGAGTIAASSTLRLGVTYSRSGLFEGAALTATIRLTNADSSPTGDFDLAVPVTNGTVLDVECTAPAGSLAGTAQLAPVASCSGAQLAPGHSLDMRLVIVAADTNDGADLLLDITAPALGIEDRTLTEAPVEVQELGLVRTSGVPAVGTPVVVCTADVSADLAGTAAAGARQPGDALRLRGAVSGNALLQPADFTVTGPDVGGITAAADCGPAQSGVSFVPGAPGTYVVTARYNTGGTNVLSLTVAGPSATPSPSPSPTPSPSPSPSPSPTPSSQVALVGPVPTAGVVGRSRLTFVVTTGTITASEVRLIVRRASDGAYWNAEAQSWQPDPAENVMTKNATRWELSVVGTARRQFAATALEVQVRVAGPAGVFEMPSPATFFVR